MINQTVTQRQGDDAERAERPMPRMIDDNPMQHGDRQDDAERGSLGNDGPQRGALLVI